MRFFLSFFLALRPPKTNKYIQAEACLGLVRALAAIEVGVPKTRLHKQASRLSVHSLGEPLTHLLLYQEKIVFNELVI